MWCARRSQASSPGIDMEGSYLDRLAPTDKFSELTFLRGKAAPVQAVITIATARGEVSISMITSPIGPAG